ncbi:MAG TPA: ribokinase [Coriobacteriia bacterium]|nr:ribokinase [Coriobacteriia bacterium]
MNDVVVVGSINVDRSVDVHEAPARGATLLGSDVRRGPGGKGANQAVALARMGRRVAMLGAVGDDEDGAYMLGILAAEGVDISGVERVDAATGQAFVFVEPDGESTIVVAPGANGALTPGMLDAHRGAFAGAKCVLVQQEVPAAVVAHAAELCQGIFVLNPAPARPIGAGLLARVDILVPNRHELATIAGVSPADDVDTVAAMARSIRGPRTVIVTLGEQGALVVEASETVHIEARAVKAIDATAAGDTFCGALVDGLLDGRDSADAARWAVRAAAVAVERRGAMDSIPHRAEVEAGP